MSERIRRALRADDGIGLIEVVVAMFLLAILALALLPTLISGMKLAVANTTIASATQLANDRLKSARAAAPDCSAVAAVSGAFDTTDARDVPLRAMTSVVGVCPSTPGSASTLTVTTVVERSDTGDELARASTLVLVTRAP